jgi:Polyketide cyclase / dehydrase and lipid transport
VVSSVERLPEWLEFAETAETLEGEAAGRLQRIHGHWGRHRSEVDQRIVAWDPPRLMAWRHEAERLDGRPSPQFARDTRFEVRLEPAAEGTRVALESVQVPASVPKGLLMRLVGGRKLGRAHERALRRLDALVAPAPTPS